MRILLVTNTQSGDGEADDIARRLRARGAEVVVEDVRDAAPLDVPAAADETPASGADADRVVVAGGDGSVGPVAALAARLGVPLAVVATGTANDFARALGLPREADAACALAADPGARTRELEIGSAGGRPFVNAASAGLSVAAAAAAHDLKGRLGALAYPLGAVRAAATAQPLDVRVRVDGEERFAGRAWQVVVASTGHFGGGSSIGGSDPGDGRLDVAVVPAGRRIALVRRAVGMLRGALTQQGPVEHVRGKAVEVDGVPEFNVDGEQCAVDPPRFSTAGRVAVVVP